MSPDSASTENVSVEVRHLRKSFNGQEVLRDVSFDVNPGEIFAIMGPSGSGKTVLLRHLIGLEHPDSGEILIQGQPVQSPDVHGRFRLAMVFQAGALLNSLTVGDNVGLYLAEHRLKPPREIARIVSQQLDAVGLRGVEDRSPSELSGGMQKRVAIARALMMDPQLILFDEPTAELDPLMAATVVGEILKLKNRCRATIVVVTHDRNIAFRIADRIAMISDGRIAAIGTPGEIKSSTEAHVQEFLRAEIPGSNPWKNQ